MVVNISNDIILKLVGRLDNQRECLVHVVVLPYFRAGANGLDASGLPGLLLEHLK